MSEPQRFWIRRWLLMAAVAGLAACSRPGWVAAEGLPDWTARQLLEAVAQRGYHDTELLILERLATAPEISKELRQSLPLRRAAALVASVRRDPDLAKRESVYVAAQQETDRLLAEADDPTVVSEAAFERGLLLLEQGRLKREQAAGDAEAIRAAAEVFRRAHVALVGSADSGLPGGSARTAVARELAGVDNRLADYRERRVLPREDRRKRDTLEENRERLRGRLAQLDLLAAEATAEGARCFPADSADRRAGLQESVRQYRTLAENQPTRAAGLWARVEEGRTLIELGDCFRGLELLGEILKLPASEELIERLQVRALAASLSCSLEKPAGADDAGLNERFRRRVLGLGPPERLDADAVTAQYRAALLLLRRAESLPADDRRRRGPIIEDVRKLATSVAKSNGDEADAARGLLEGLDSRGQAAARRLRQTFAATVARAGQALAAVQTDPSEPRRQVAIRLVREAVTAGLTDPPDDASARRQQLLQLRYQLAYLLHASRRDHEAAALGEHFVATLPAEPVSRKAAAVALASWQRLCRQPNDAWGRAAVRRLARLAEAMMRQWPEDAESAAAAKLAIDLAAAAADLPAIETILQGLSPANPDRAAVLLRGGVAIWQHCRAVDIGPTQSGSEPPSDCGSRAAGWLDQGLALIAADPELPAAETPVAIAAAVARCQIAFQQRDAAAAQLLPLLTHPGYGLWNRLAEPAPELPGQLVESGLSCCLRGFTLAGRNGLAIAALAALRENSAGNPEAAVRLAATAGLLGQEIVEELQSLAAAAAANHEVPSRLDLLSRLLAVAATPTSPRSVMLWAATTLGQLGRAAGPIGAVVPQDRQREFLDRAAAVTERLLAEAAAPQRPALRLQLAELWAAIGRWQEAVEQLELTVADSRAGRSVLVQREVAERLEALAKRQPDGVQACQLYHDAAVGRTVEGGAIWGWGGLASRISRQAFRRDDDEARQLRQLYFEARYRLAGCRLAWARREDDAKARRKRLQQAAAELEIETRLHPDLGGREFRDRFGQLREQVEQELRGVTEGTS